VIGLLPKAGERPLGAVAAYVDAAGNVRLEWMLESMSPQQRADQAADLVQALTKGFLMLGNARLSRERASQVVS